jgi:putative two-component system response regulator
MRMKFLLDQLERAESVITTLGLTIEARDPYTAGHCERLARYAVGLGPLDAEERAVIQIHPVIGADLVNGMHTLDSVRPIIRHHHERFNGSGYPDGLKGEEIPLGARIMSVVDVYDALCTARPYKPAFSHEVATDILLRETEGGSWDPQIVRAFIAMCRDPQLSVAP